MLRVLVCGSREWCSPGVVFDRMLELPRGTEVIHGGARGVDQLAASAAEHLDLPARAYPADWEKHGKRAGILRNLDMLDAHPDLVIAFWDGESRGTAHTIAEAQKRGIPVEVIARVPRGVTKLRDAAEMAS